MASSTARPLPVQPSPWLPIAATLTLALASGICHAQASGAPAKPAPAAAAQPAPKPATKPAAKAAPKAAPAAPAAAALPAASAEQLTAADITHVGDYACEFDEVVKVAHHPQHRGYVDVQHRKAVYTMKPVLSSTGALRLEDVRGRMLMLQIANKSMLMDTRVGQRVVDGCVHEKQRAFANPPAGQSLGIAPPAAGASAPR